MSEGPQIASLCASRVALVSFVVLQAVGILFTRYHVLFLLRFSMATIQCSAVRTHSRVQNRGAVWCAVE